MEKNEYRVVIKFFVWKGLSTTEIHSELVDVLLKQSVLSFSPLHRWALEFKQSRISGEDNPQKGRPKSATHQ